MKWADATGYSQGGSREQMTWQAKIADLRITITKGHIYAKDRWVMHCDPWFNTHDMGPNTEAVEGVQRRAIEKVRTKIAAVNAALDNHL